MSRTYTEAEKAEAVGLATAIGPLKAARQLGIPPRTVANWMHRPASSAVIAAVETTIAERLAEAHERALAAVLSMIDDPKAKLGEKARALEVLGQQRALAEGRATANIEQHTYGGGPIGDVLTDLSEEQWEGISNWLWSYAALDLGSIVLMLPTDVSHLTEELVVEATRAAWRERMRQERTA